MRMLSSSNWYWVTLRRRRYPCHDLDQSGKEAVLRLKSIRLSIRLTLFQ
jgi:hypothetical protein